MPKKYNWATLRKFKGAELEVHYIETLRELGTEKGMLGQIFTKAQNKIQDPAKLARIIEMVDSTQWCSRRQAAPPSSCPTTSSSRAEKEKACLA